MRDDFLPFSRPEISEGDIAAVADVLRSGWITTGPRNTEFENAFCEYTGSQFAVALSSATAAMHLVLKALGIGKGDEVITPSMTWVSTVNLIVLCGATPVFADVERDTMMVSVESVKKCITPRTRVIIPVHFAGSAFDIMPLRQLAANHNIAIVEDAAHAVGTEYMGSRIGWTGTAIFSFHPIKNMTTGEGGMLCTDDSVLAERVRRLKFHGLGVDAYDRHTQGRSPQAEVLEPGYKYNMTDISATLGLRQLARLDEFNDKRRELVSVYHELLRKVPEVMPLKDPPYSILNSRHLFIVRLDTDKAGISRDEFMEQLKQLNIGTGIHFKAVHLQKYYRDSMGMKRGMLPNTEWNSDRICSLPLFPGMSSYDVADVVRAIKKVLK